MLAVGNYAASYLYAYPGKLVFILGRLKVIQDLKRGARGEHLLHLLTHSAYDN